MPSVTTLADIRNEEVSVQTLVLRDRHLEDASVQTSLPSIPNTSNLNESLRDVARQRLERGESNLPLRSKLDGNPIEDSADFKNLNELLDEDTRLEILNSIANDNYRSDLVQIILSNLPENTIDRLVNTLQGPLNNLETYTPFINILMYGNVGLNDFNVATTNLINLITDLRTPSETPVLDVDETVANIEERNQSTNQNVREGVEESNSSRTNIPSSLNWRTLLTRSGMLLAAGTATYFGAPQLGSLANLGVRILQDLEYSSNTVSNSRESRIT
jgi:hypothetical protein